RQVARRDPTRHLGAARDRWEVMSQLTPRFHVAFPRLFFTPPFHVSFPRLLFTSFVVTACSHKPPADFAPDPGLVAQVRDIRIVTTQARACPGATLQASYEAVLTDGTRVPFARAYDKKHPPRPHVGLPARSSQAPPFYMLADATEIPPSDWLLIESRGGRGGTGTPGPKGADGADGGSGCPPQPGGPGGNGANGGPGGSGGRGGRINVVVSSDEP